jgi:hypothetical protein
MNKKLVMILLILIVAVVCFFFFYDKHKTVVQIGNPNERDDSVLNGLFIPNDNYYRDNVLSKKNIPL